MMLTRTRKLLILFLLGCTLFLAGLYAAPFVQSYTQPSYYTFENAPCAADTYLIYKSGGVYYSRNTDSGVVSSDANCTTLVHALRDAMGNGTIFFKPGIYTLNLVIDKNDVTIKGDGHNSTYFRNDNANPVIDVQGLSGDSLRGITIEDVTVHGTGTSGIGIRATHCYHTLTLEGVRVQGMDSYGVYLEYCYDALLQDCIIQSNSDWGVYADQCHAMGITDCYIIDNGDSTAGNIHLNHTAGSSIHGTTIENSKYGVKISDNAHGVTISNSFLEVNNEGSNLVWITGNSTVYPKNTVIENSFFEGKSGTWPDAYIYIDYATETKVEGNYLPVYPGMIGINITAHASYTKIEGNQFRSTGTFLTDLGTDTTIIQPQNQGFWWSGDNRTDLIANPTSEATFIVETDGTYTWMTNCSTGQRDATGTDADQIINWALGNLTSGRDWLETVYLKGDFIVNGSDPIITISAYTRLAGNAIITLANNAPTARIFSATDQSHIEIRDLTIDGNRVNQGGVGHTGIHCQNGVDIQIVNVNITQLEQSGGGVKGRGIWLNWCNDTLIHECTLSYIEKTGIEMHECYRNTITDNHLLHIDDANNGGFLSIQDYNNDHGYDTIISGNQFVNNTAGGHPFISVSNASRLLITGNTFNQSASYDIRLGRVSSGLQNATSDYTIVSNNIFANGYGLYLTGDCNQIISNNFHATNYGVVLWGCSQYTPEFNLVANNHISDSTSYSIYFPGSGGHNNTIQGNFIYNSGNSGIHMGTASDDNALLDNTFRGIAAPNEAIYIGNANCNSTLIDGNDMRFNNDDVDDSGTGTIWGDNVDKDGNFDQGVEP